MKNLFLFLPLIFLLAACSSTNEVNIEPKSASTSEAANTSNVDSDITEKISNIDSNREVKLDIPPVTVDDFEDAYLETSSQIRVSMDIAGEIIDAYRSGQNPPIEKVSLLSDSLTPNLKALDDFERLTVSSDLEEIHNLGVSAYTDITKANQLICMWYVDNDDSLIDEAIELRQRAKEAFGELSDKANQWGS